MTNKLIKIRTGIFQRGVRNDIDQFKLHINGIESYLEKEVKDFIHYHEERTNDFSQEEKEEYYEINSDNYWQLNEVFPNIQRKSELIGIYTLLEHHLNLLCSVYEKHSNSQIKLSDLRANGIIDTAKKYLEKVVGISFPSNSQSWQEVKKVQKIRNIFVHNDGKLRGSDGDKRAIKQYIDSSPFLELDQFERILIKKGFTDHCLDLFRGFFDDLYNVVNQFEK